MKGSDSKRIVLNIRVKLGTTNDIGHFSNSDRATG
jgi:hypothetical protein